MIAVAVSRICGLPDVLAGSLDGCASLELKGAANSTEASAALLERALNAEHELTSITFADAPLGDEGASRLAALLPGRGGTLRTLRLDRCGVGAAGAADLGGGRRGHAAAALALAVGPRARRGGRTSLAAALRGAATAALAHLQPSARDLGAANAAARRGRRRQRVLAKLTLDGNDVGDDGAKALAAALRGDGGRPLATLDLGTTT